MHDPLSFFIKNTNATVEETRQLIDEAIEGCQNTILALRSQRNDVASTSCLPPEILCRIFCSRSQTTRGKRMKWMNKMNSLLTDPYFASGSN